jgi:NADPH2 dehydrogenase
MPTLSDALQIGNCNLSSRLIMAPMTRLRATNDQVSTPLMTEYYAQRAHQPGTLIITEAVFISASSRGRDLNAPGIFTSEQIAAWADVARAVHQRQCYIFMQLWHVGRAARPHVLQQQGLEMVSSSAVPIGADYSTPREMSESEIQTCIADFADAAQNAVEGAGFDGVEIHAANGYLIDQFTQDTCNQRTDRWGGSIENRSRFAYSVAEAVADRVGPHRVGLRLAPFTDFQGMGMKDPIPQFEDLITRLKPLRLGYLHLVEPRVSGNSDREQPAHESLDFALRAWGGTAPVILAGGYKPDSAKVRLAQADAESLAIAIGRLFTSNPDLPQRFIEDLPLEHYDRETFYKVGSADGYTTWPVYTHGTNKS